MGSATAADKGKHQRPARRHAGAGGIVGKPVRHGAQQRHGLRPTQQKAATKKDQRYHQNIQQRRSVEARLKCPAQFAAHQRTSALI